MINSTKVMGKKKQTNKVLVANVIPGNTQDAQKDTKLKKGSKTEEKSVPKVLPKAKHANENGPCVVKFPNIDAITKTVVAIRKDAQKQSTDGNFQYFLTIRQKIGRFRKVEL